MTCKRRHTWRFVANQLFKRSNGVTVARSLLVCEQCGATIRRAANPHHPVPTE